MNKRFWEIDVLRGIAIVMMIIFHTLFNLNYFGEFNFDVSSGFWFYFARITAGLFILLVGVSLSVSYSRIKENFMKKKVYLKYIKRGLIVFSYGLLITLATWIFMRDGFVVFGILHLIGASIILAIPFLKFKWLNLMLGFMIIFVGIYLRSLSFDFSFLLPLGFIPKGFYSLDYFSIFPWFGVVLIGISLGNVFYEKHERKFEFPDLSRFSLTKIFSFLGRKSLLIYLLHQPILLVLLSFLGFIDLGL